MPLDKLTKHWIKGLLAAMVSGGAGGVTSGLAAIGIAPESFNLGAGIGHTVKLMGATFLINAFIGTFGYLKQSPVPPDEDPQESK